MCTPNAPLAAPRTPLPFIFLPPLLRPVLRLLPSPLLLLTGPILALDGQGKVMANKASPSPSSPPPEGRAIRLIKTKCIDDMPAHAATLTVGRLSRNAARNFPAVTSLLLVTKGVVPFFFFFFLI